VNCWAVIPVKNPSEGKSRLAGTLAPADRETLVEDMLEHVLDTTARARNVDKTCLLGLERRGVPSFPDPGGGLNPALQSMLASVGGESISRLVVIAADLPLLSAQEVELLAAAPEGTVAIAPDRHGTGTNALSLPLPRARGFSFAFGTDSFARHRAEAERLGLSVEVIHGHGLARDVDVPEDLGDVAARTGQSG